MLFNSYVFLFLFLPVSVIGYWLLGRWQKRAQTIWLIAANVIFYVVTGIGYLALLLTMTLMTYIAGRYLLNHEQQRRRRLGLLLVLANLLILIFFKYANLLAAPLSNNLLTIALPLGISFYTFNLVSYGLDVYRKLATPETDMLDFVAHLTFFPTILSGPLTRYTNLAHAPEGRTAQVELGVFMLTLGLAKKVLIADTIAAQVNPLFADTSHLGIIASWAAVLGYAYQLYFDFSGYTDMATGIAYLLGYKLPQNFNAPYTARNITEFWQKWHITLSNWFRDYLFLPLSRALLRRDPKNPDRVRTISLIITMTLTGMWHGASPTFIIWGAYHGVMLAIHAQSRRWKWKPLPTLLARGITFFGVLLGWVIFRSNSLESALNLYAGMFGLHGLRRDYLWTEPNPTWFIVTLAILFIVTNLSRDTWELKPRDNWAYAIGLALLLVLSIAFIGQTSTFLYLQF
ncbi:MAG: MBOAT family O-acyltransferase [Anaerolineae bacterium]